MPHSALLPLPKIGAPPEPKVPAAHRFTLANGLRVVAVNRPDLPRVAARLLIPAGSVADPEGLSGLATMVAAMILEGAGNRDALDFHRQIDFLGATLDSRVTHDFFEIDLGLLSETLEEGLGLLHDVVATPQMPSSELERLRLETLDAIEARADEPANVADDLLTAALFGDHPYGRLALGSLESVERIHRDDVVQFHKERIRPDGSCLIIAGDIGEDLGQSAIEKALGGWSGKVPPLDVPALSEGYGSEMSILNEPIDGAAQGEIRVAARGMARNDADWVPAAVANYILGGSTITGRLGSNLREDKGWTYGVRSGFGAGRLPSGWIVETAVGAEVASDAVREIHQEIVRIVSESVDNGELQRARESLILSLPRAFETPGRIVSRLATVEAFGLPVDYWEQFPDRVRAVDASTVSSMAKRYFDPDRLISVVVGPAIS